jgi:hypothetical protein
MSDDEIERGIALIKAMLAEAGSCGECQGYRRDCGARASPPASVQRAEENRATERRRDELTNTEPAGGVDPLGERYRCARPHLARQ